jgi:hypothetical protein
MSAGDFREDPVEHLSGPRSHGKASGLPFPIEGFAENRATVNGNPAPGFYDQKTRSNTQVKQVMTGEIATCPPNTNLAVVAALMWDNDCGFVPSSMPSGRSTCEVDDRREFRGFADVPQVGEQAIRDIKSGVGNADQSRLRRLQTP